MAQANQAKGSLQQIDSNVKQVVGMIQGIAAVTRSQSQATEFITSWVEQIVQMARDNGKHIDHATEASHDFRKLSEHFRQVVSRFKT